MEYNFFEIIPDIDKYIDQDDKNALRGMIVGVINRDPTFATSRYYEIMDYIGKRISIWDDKEITLPGEYSLLQDQWDKDYFRINLTWLSQNFTKKRLQTVSEIGKKVYASENTWGKEEAANFQRPISNSKQEKSISQNGIGKNILAVIISSIILLVLLIVPNQIVQENLYLMGIEVSIGTILILKTLVIVVIVIILIFIMKIIMNRRN